MYLIDDLLDDARTEYLNLCDASGTDATEFEAQCLSAVWPGLELDEDDETNAELHATIAAIKGGDKNAATAPYYGWLQDQSLQAAF